MVLACIAVEQGIFALLEPFQGFTEASVPLWCEKLNNFLMKPFGKPRATCLLYFFNHDFFFVLLAISNPLISM